MKRDKLRLRFLLLLAICLSAIGLSAKANATDTIMVMPFENRSQMGEYNWIRESFVILMSDVLDVPGIVILSADERNIAFEKLRLSPNDILTRAADHHTIIDVTRLPGCTVSAGNYHGVCW